MSAVTLHRLADCPRCGAVFTRVWPSRTGEWPFQCGRCWAAWRGREAISLPPEEHSWFPPSANLGAVIEPSFVRVPARVPLPDSAPVVADDPWEDQPYDPGVVSKVWEWWEKVRGKGG